MEIKGILGLLLLILITGCNTLPDCKKLNLSEDEQSKLECHSEYYQLSTSAYICHNTIYIKSDGLFESALPITEHCYLEQKENNTFFELDNTGGDCLDYNNLNYTTLQISREEFEKLPCYRQIDWINGACYPSACHEPNPPVCTAIIAVMCFELNETPESAYFDHIFINKSKG